MRKEMTPETEKHAFRNKIDKPSPTASFKGLPNGSFPTPGKSFPEHRGKTFGAKVVASSNNGFGFHVSL